MESLSHMTARHDYNWAKVAPQVARVRPIMAEFWGALGHLTVFWHQRVKCEPALAHICRPDLGRVLGCGIGEIWVENCIRLAALILALGAVLAFQITSVYTVGTPCPFRHIILHKLACEWIAAAL